MVVPGMIAACQLAARRNGGEIEFAEHLMSARSGFVVNVARGFRFED
jgi:hypothetical protein